MSYYYNYYIGILKDNKVYPLGPYDCGGKLMCTLWRSRSFASDLHEDFNALPDDWYSEELKNTLCYTDINGEKQPDTVKYLPIDELGSDDFIKKGYFLLEDIKTYTNDPDAADLEDLFWERLTPEAFAIKLQNELTYGKPEQKYDCEGNPLENYSCADYAYFAYPDRTCREYEVFCIRNVASTFEFSDFGPSYKNKDAKIVILETEG